MLDRRFLLREIWQGRKQALIFIFCVALSLATMVALNGFRRDIDRGITGDARALHGGDIILHSHYELSPGLRQAVERMQRQGRVAQAADTWGFYSLIRSVKDQDTLFANLKVATAGYPLYGRVELQSGRRLDQALKPGDVVVAADVLHRMRLQIGDRLHIGEAILRIADVVAYESARPVDLFSFGPRVFVAAADLEAIDLIRKGSRVNYETVLKVSREEEVEELAAALKDAAIAGQERVETYRTAGSRIKRFFDNLLFFLSLISLFTLLLAGIGMQSSLTALLREKEMTLAIVKSLGATRGFLYRHYLVLALVLGMVGSAAGSAAGLLLEGYLPRLFAGLLPPGSRIEISFLDLLQGMGLGLAVVLFFTFLPLSRLNRVKPAVIFKREESDGNRRAAYYLTRAAGLVFLTVLVVLQLRDLEIGLWFVGGSLALILVMSLLARAVLQLARRWTPHPLALRLAVRSLVRPGNATRAIVVTLSSALAILLAIFLLERNLRQTFIDSYPAEAPNLFSLDIQKDQRDGFRQLVGEDVQMFPVIRARLVSINGKAVQREKEDVPRGDSLTREFNLTYRDDLLPDEELLAGRALFRAGNDGRIGLQVSVLDTVAEMGDMEIGDVLRFSIQGVPLEAEVTSIRTRTRSKLYPFFYFVFPPVFLEKAPQTYFAALHRHRDEIPALESRIVTAYPNVSIINMAASAAELGGLMQKLSGIIRFFAGFSLLAGALILVSSILATRLARVREAVYYKVLGARSSFVLGVFVHENLLLGLASATFAVVLAQVLNWAVCRFVLEIAVRPDWLATLAAATVTVALVVLLGVLSSTLLLRQKPADFLREQGGE